jgi:hypothetical protein
MGGFMEYTIEMALDGLERMPSFMCVSNIKSFASTV